MTKRNRRGLASRLAAFAMAVMITAGLTVSAGAASTIGQTAAKKIALEKVPGATITDIEYEKGYYEIELVKGSKEYDMTIVAKNGKIAEYGWEREVYTQSKTKPNIGKTKAKSIANDKVPGATIIYVKLKSDDGIKYYDLDLKKGSRYYEMEINAKTGTIISYEWVNPSLLGL